MNREGRYMAPGAPGRGTGAVGGTGAAPKRPSSTRKLICPCCGQSVRATKKVHILCGDCMAVMEEVA